MADRIDYERGQIDDVVITGVTMFRMEAMDDRTMWIRLYREGGKDIVFWLGAVKDGDKVKMTATHNFDFEKDDKPDVEVSNEPAQS